MLDKTLDDLTACEDLATSRLVELKKVESKSKLQETKIRELEALIINLRERIYELEQIKCTEFVALKLFWGLVKIGQFKKCN